MKKILVVSSVISMIEWFNQDILNYLNKHFDVSLATNLDYFEDTNENSARRCIANLKAQNIHLFNVHFSRNPFSFSNIKAFYDIRRIMKKESFDLIHTHTPTASFVSRMAAYKFRKNGTKVLYTCHGFHFHKTSPMKNWILYYPIERLLSYVTDDIITINTEDYNVAKSFNTSIVHRINGVGVDISKYKNVSINVEDKRKELNLTSTDVALLSVGELIPRKNHEIIIRAISSLQNKRNIKYFICGKGQLDYKLKKLVKQLSLENIVFFLGFRTDISELCHACDIFVFPSKIEGLGLAGIEAMASGLPVISSNIHGILEYVYDGCTGYTCKPNSITDFASAINKLSSDPHLRLCMKENCLSMVDKFDKSISLTQMINIYKNILKF